MPRLVSVVVPTRDRPALLREALVSIRAEESADFTFEILVGDNGTMPGVAELVAEFGGVYTQTAKNGCAAARNVAMRRATGEFVTFLDDDDVWVKGHIAPLVAYLDARAELDVVIAQVIATDSNLRPRGAPEPEEDPRKGGDMLRALLNGFYPQMASVLARRRVLDRVGYYDEDVLSGQDQDWLLRSAHFGRVGYSAVPCVYFRGRPEGDLPSFDALAFKRVGFNRRIFLRHAVKNWRIWRSPLDFLNGYKHALDHFYWYFLSAAVARAGRGERALALRAAWRAFLVFPLRAVTHAFTNGAFRSALLSMLLGRPALVQALPD